MTLKDDSSRLLGKGKGLAEELAMLLVKYYSPKTVASIREDVAKAGMDVLASRLGELVGSSATGLEDSSSTSQALSRRSKVIYRRPKRV